MNQPAPTILVIDDEHAIRRMLQISLEARGYRVQTVATGAAALVALVDHPPDLVILDLILPDMDGMNILQRLREWSQVPVIVLSVQSDEQRKIDLLDLGADDYVTKPFGMGELLARVRVALRHAARQVVPEATIQTGELVIDLTAHQVTRAGQPIHLTPTEYQLLRLLASNLGRVLTHGTILRAVWGPGSQQDTQLLRGFIAQVRHKIEPQPNHPTYILTEPGIGYRMVEYPAGPPAATSA